MGSSIDQYQLEHEARLWRAQQMQEIQSRRKTVEAAASSGADAVGQLRAYLSTHLVRVIDLLRSWDEDGTGYIDRHEFRKALPALGMTIDRQGADMLFDSFDTDGSELLTLGELEQQLRQHVELHPSLQVGTMGHIEL